jgi:hypothetical protein
VLTVKTISRAPNGKVDYRRLRQYAIDTTAAVDAAINAESSLS